VRAVDDVSLSVAAGEVFGIAGPNGAGKSTIIAMLLGFLEPTDGRLRVGGMSPRTFAESEGVGYLSELVAVPPEWRAEDALRRYALLDGVADEVLDDTVSRAINRLGLEPHRRKRMRQLSKGNAQRVGLAQAILRDHRLVILDEPTHGLDPVWTQKFRDLVHELRAADRVIVIASHNLDELERVADRVAIVDKGRVQRIVDVRAAMASSAAAGRWRVQCQAGLSAVAAEFPNAVPAGDGRLDVSVDDLASANAALARAIAAGAVITHFAPVESGLERAFRDAVGGAS
jgi:ABC-2 type transport system ATP-binding protein